MTYLKTKENLLSFFRSDSYMSFSLAIVIGIALVIIGLIVDVYLFPGTKSKIHRKITTTIEKSILEVTPQQKKEIPPTHPQPDQKTKLATVPPVSYIDRSNFYKNFYRNKKITTKITPTKQAPTYTYKTREKGNFLYKWINEKGNEVYSNIQPQPGIKYKVIKLPGPKNN